MRRIAQVEKEGLQQLHPHLRKHIDTEAGDNVVFWSVVSVVAIFVVALAIVITIRSGMTGQIVLGWYEPSAPYARNPYACLDVPPCRGDNSFMCCAEQPLSNGRKCTAPLKAGAGSGYGTAFCPSEMPNMCTCPEKYPYRQTWPVPSR